MGQATNGAAQAPSRDVPQVSLYAEGWISYPPELGIPPQKFVMRAGTLTAIHAEGTVTPPPAEDDAA